MEKKVKAYFEVLLDIQIKELLPEIESGASHMSPICDSAVAELL
jgi:hypothetical protein